MCNRQVHKIYVIIPTAFRRTNLLLTRSLPSVYMQIGVPDTCVEVLIVDDNPKTETGFSSEFHAIKFGVDELRRVHSLPSDSFRTTVVPNNRIQGRSGTGAWNTGIFSCAEKPDLTTSFIALLDDDDEWLPTYLLRCASMIDVNTAAVFASLTWVTEGVNEDRILRIDDITQESFYIGNPGIQGSNTFIATRFFLALNGFDESFPNCNDRELMIRLLDHISGKALIKVIPDVLVRHYNHHNVRVNTDTTSKHQALGYLEKLVLKAF